MSNVMMRSNGRKYTLRTKSERKRLAFEVWLAHLRGLSIYEIAQVKGITEASVAYCLQEAKRHSRFEYDQLTKDAIAQQLYADTKERVKHLWVLFQTTHDDHVKVRILEALGREDERMISCGQELGMIPRAPAKHEISGPGGGGIPYVAMDTGTDRADTLRLNTVELDAHGNGT